MNRRPQTAVAGFVLVLASLFGSDLGFADQPSSTRPHIVLVMSDDQGYGQVGYAGHPILETPNLDTMARNGLRFDRFYAAAPVCSPTRASVLTGRTNDRTGVFDHGFALRRQERTIVQALSKAGYLTGHFGKWHLNGIRGPGVPILKGDDHNPSVFGYANWLATTNFFDRDPLLSRNGAFEEFAGDSSEIIVEEALKFLTTAASSGRPAFATIWYGTPHRPFIASEADRAAFADLSPDEQNHYGELVAMDRSIGRLRRGLRELGIAESTLLWFCSDNGGLSEEFGPSTVGHLRGGKTTMYEGGLRVPAIVEWPSVIASSRTTDHLASTMDIAPTLLDIVGLDASRLIQPQDGLSLRRLLEGDSSRRGSPIRLRHRGRGVAIDRRFKLYSEDLDASAFVLYDLEADPAEMRDVSAEHPDVFDDLKREFFKWNASVERSVRGEDYPEGVVDPSEPSPRQWRDMDEYRPYFDAWRERPEYRSRFRLLNVFGPIRSPWVLSAGAIVSMSVIGLMLTWPILGRRSWENVTIWDSDPDFSEAAR